MTRRGINNSGRRWPAIRGVRAAFHTAIARGDGLAAALRLASATLDAQRIVRERRAAELEHLQALRAIAAAVLTPDCPELPADPQDAP